MRKRHRAGRGDSRRRADHCGTTRRTPREQKNSIPPLALYRQLYGGRAGATMTAPNLDRRARAHFDRLSRDEQVEAIRRLAHEGLGDYEIAHATKLSVEMIRRVLGARAEART
jgi:hypothetical protein